MVATPCQVCWDGQKCPWHRVGVCSFTHGGMPSLLKEMEDLRPVVCKLTAKLMWLSVVDVPQVREVAELGEHLPAGSLPVPLSPRPPKRINERVMEQMVHVPVPQMLQQSVL